MKYLAAILAILLGLSCSKENIDPIDDNNKTDDRTVAQLKSAIIDANNNFALDLFREIEKNESEGDNIFISPLSIYYALAMAYNGSMGQTKEEFENVLGIGTTNRENFHNSISQLYDEIVPQNDDITLEIANSIWPEKRFEVKTDYMDEIRQFFHAEVKPFDVSNPASVDSINDWIADKTHDKIQDMLDIIPGDAVLYLINAIYFYGNWKYQFDDTSNYTGSFMKSNGSAMDVTYMKQKATLKYTKNDLFSAVKLPYADSSYYMVIMVPETNISIKDLTAQMGTETWKNWNDNFAYKNVMVNLPKFSFAFGNRTINKELIDLGLKKAFTDQSDFTAITDRQIFINRVIHKAFVDVNEKGTEAAAATIVEMLITSEGDGTSYFIADKPFLFAICEESTQSIIFMGKVAFPEQ